MARKTPPHYSATARGAYVPATDTAWDFERIDREVAALKEAGKDPDEHPVTAYDRGETRFDLDAVLDLDGVPVRPRDYLTGGEPEVFFLRRLTWSEYDDVERTPAANWRTKFLRACRLGITHAENSPIEIKATAGAGLTDDSMQRLHDADPDLPILLGLAVWRYNKPPTESEGKVSAS